MGITRKTCAAAAAGVLTMALAGCGDDGDSGGGDDAEEFTELSVEEIKTEVLTDMREAESLRLSGTQNEGGEEISIDMGLTTGGECAGSMTAGGGTAEIISGPEGTFIKAEEAFWDAAAQGQGAQITEVLGDKWALLPESAAGNFSEICDLESFIEELEDDEDEADAEKGEVGEVDGQEALEILGEDDETGATTHVWVATEDPHYILSASSEDEEEGGEITFSDYDEPVDTTPPAEDEYVDLGQVS